MRRFLTGLIMAAAVVPLAAQAPDPPDLQQIAAAIKSIQEQQAQMAANQTRMEEKLGAVGEDLRQARLFAGRDE